MWQYGMGNLFTLPFYAAIALTPDKSIVQVHLANILLAWLPRCCCEGNKTIGAILPKGWYSWQWGTPYFFIK